MQAEFIYDDNPPEMKPDQVDVWRVVHRHRGRDSAILARDIASVTGISERTVRKIIRSLRLEFHKPIGSNTGSPAGYYLAVTLEELQDVAETWIDFGVRALIMARRLVKYAPDDFLNQVAMKLEQEN